MLGFDHEAAVDVVAFHGGYGGAVSLEASATARPLVGRDDIEAARAVLRGVLRPTAVEASQALSKIAGQPVLLKHEERQRTGSFKVRGAYHRISRLPDAVRRLGVVAASAGNHAQGVALAASVLDVTATVFMPETAAFPKVDATRKYGAEVRLVGGIVDDALGAAREFADETGATFIPPFDDFDVVAGQGTVGLEVLEQAPEVGTIVVPVGGGGLIAGVAAAVKSTRPEVRVIGVEAAAAAAMSEALVAGRPAPLARVETMADGIAVRSVSELTLAHAHAFVDDVVTVGEEQISSALLLLLERAKSLVEPAAAAALAAVLAHKATAAPDAPTCVILSGGNVDPLVLMRIVQHGLAASGRYLILRVRLPDQPGELAGLLQHLSRLGLNVMDVEHHREGSDLRVDEVEVRLSLETRDPTHRDEVVDHLRTAGYRVEAG